MKIYIDGLFYLGSGIGRYYESITKELARNGFEIITAVPVKYKNVFLEDFKDIPLVKPIFVNYEKFSIKGYILQSFLLRQLSKEINIFFFPHINLPFYVPKKTIVTIHDLIPFTKIWDRSIVKSFIYKYFLYRSIKKSRTLICISETVKNELITFNKSAQKKVQVIYEFPEEKFIRDKFFEEKSVIDKPYILFVGNRKKHKNLRNLLLAFNELKESLNHILVIAGSKDSKIDEVDELISRLNLQDKVVQIVSPDDNTIRNLYKYADLFVFPSFIEGFGLPPLEAISMGCPVIMSNIPILKEIFNDSALYFNPLDIKDISSCIKQILNDDVHRKILLEKEKQIIECFKKEEIINKYIILFKKVAKDD